MPGDEIIGYITKGRGVSIHRTDCQNMEELIKDENRVINVSWYIDSNGSVLDEKPNNTNVWRERGLTSENVVFNKAYHCEEDDDNVILYSDGRWFWGDDEEMEDPSNIEASSVMQDAIESEPVTCVVGRNYILFTFGEYNIYVAF